MKGTSLYAISHVILFVFAQYQIPSRRALFLVVGEINGLLLTFGGSATAVRG
jgi:hypothetical protein